MSVLKTKYEVDQQVSDARRSDETGCRKRAWCSGHVCDVRQVQKLTTNAVGVLSVKFGVLYVK